MRTTQFELGRGTVLVLEKPADLKALSKPQRELVTERLLSLWQDPAGVLGEWGKRATIPSFKQWLALATHARPTLQLILPEEYFAPRALLALNFGPRTSTQFPHLKNWTLSIDGGLDASELASATPPALREVHQTVGGVWTQYAASNYLVPPDELQPLSKAPGRAHLEACALEVANLDLARCFSFYSSDGDRLCFDAEQRAFWLGNEWGDPGEVGAMTLAQALDDLFATLCEQRCFNMSEHKERQERLRR